MAKDFTVKNGQVIETILATVATDTVIEAGDLVALSSGVITKATATSTAVAYCPNGSADGEVLTEVSVGNDFTLVGTADANFAVTDKGEEVDIVVSSDAQLIDLGEDTYKVLKVGISNNSGTNGSKLNVEVKINKPLF
jgi:hypothetical protein